MKHAFWFARAARGIAAPLAGAVAIASAAFAATAPPISHPTSQVIERPAAGGMVVGIDRETGMLVMPEPAQLARLIARRERAVVPSQRPAPVYRANGIVSLDVRSWMRDYAVVRLGADGKPSMDCLDRADAVTRTLHTPPAPAALEER
jgi:hypothetical protein